MSGYAVLGIGLALLLVLPGVWLAMVLERRYGKRWQAWLQRLRGR